MIYIVLLALLSILLVLYMVKEAFENNVLYHDHEIQMDGHTGNIVLFFISDVHVRKVNKEMIKSIPKKVDAVIIGGDFADKRTPTERIYANINVLKSLGPIYFVWGNNDREVGEERLRTIFKETGVHIIEDDAVLLNKDNRIWLSAVDFTAKTDTKFDKVFEKVNEDALNIFISHNPQIFPTILRNYKVDFLMGGHLHGGQIRLGPFGVHPPGSFSTVVGVPTLISNGYGTTFLPLRLGAKPQCHVIDVKITAKAVKMIKL